MLNYTEDFNEKTEEDQVDNRQTLIDELNLLCKDIHQMNRDKGFWEGTQNVGEKIALMHSELSEALEANRKNLMDDKLPEYRGLSVELADCLIRIFDFCGAYNIPIGEIMFKKLDYNSTRPYKHGKLY